MWLLLLCLAGRPVQAALGLFALRSADSSIDLSPPFNPNHFVLPRMLRRTLTRFQLDRFQEAVSIGQASPGEPSQPKSEPCLKYTTNCLKLP